MSVRIKQIGDVSTNFTSHVCKTPHIENPNVGHTIGEVRMSRSICSCIGPPRSPLRVAWCEILTRSNKSCAATAEAVTVAADRPAVSQEQMFLRGAVTCDQGSKGLDSIDFDQNHES